MPGKISQHVHEEQTFLTQVGSVAMRLKIQSARKLNKGDARRHLENQFSKIFKTGVLPEDKASEREIHGDIWESWEQGRISLSSKKLHLIFEEAYGPTPLGSQRHPLPKSDAGTLKELEKVLANLHSRDSKNRIQLGMEIETFKQALTPQMKLTVGTQTAEGFQWKLPAELQDMLLINAFYALEFYRGLYLTYLIPSSLTIPDIERLLRLVERRYTQET